MTFSIDHGMDPNRKKEKERINIGETGCKQLTVFCLFVLLFLSLSVAQFANLIERGSKRRKLFSRSIFGFPRYLFGFS